MHNYLMKLEKLIQDWNDKDHPPGIHNILIVHDDLCGFFKNKECDCDPEIKFLEKKDES